MKNSNSKYVWREYQDADLDAIELQEDEREHILMARDTFSMMSRMNNNDTIFLGTAYYGDVLLAIGGWLEIEPGLAEGFIIPSRPALEHKFVLVRTFLVWLRQLQKLTWPKRIQSHSLPIMRIDRWMVALGFVYEGSVKRYTESEQEYKLWSRTKTNGTWGHI